KCYTPDKEKSGKYKYDPSQVYPANREYWQQWFPADFLTESLQGQFRNWFYAILTMSTVLEGRAPFECLLGHALVKDEKGDDMHKSAGNSIPFDEAAGKIGADLMRWVFCCQNPVINLNFGYHMATEFKRKLLTLHNVYSFYITYAKLDGFVPKGKSLDKCQLTLLDNWILSELNLLVKNTRQNLDNYDAASACKKLEAFTEDLSTWYVRRSRRRFWKSESDSDKEAAYLTLYTCLETLIRLMSPIMPFWAEEMHQNLVRSIDATAPQSVHLTAYPQVDEKRIDQKLSQEMAVVRKVVSLGHAARKEARLNVRQPLQKIIFKTETDNELNALKKYKDIVKDEINIKTIDYVYDIDILIDFSAKPVFSILGPKHGKNANKVAQLITSLNDEQVKMLIAKREDVFRLGDENINVNLEDIEIVKKAKDNYCIKQDGGYSVGLYIIFNEKLEEEGYVRKLVHRIQNLRKDNNLEVADRIVIYINSTNEYSKNLLNNTEHREFIMTETLAKDIIIDNWPTNYIGKSDSFEDGKLQMGLGIQKAKP
ncbi:MAG: DUF5915 domain-containing protein, partial [bacterium]|nr:DUF5915 domain-containing protein [bacterium]